VMLDTEKLKDAFHYRLGLAIEGQAGGTYLDSGTANDDTYVSHILAEEKRRDRRRVERWERVRKRNDLFDCECMNLALANPEWPGGGVNILQSAGAGNGETPSSVRAAANAQNGLHESLKDRRINPWAGRRMHG
jgi:hypothetical protein